MRPGRMPRKYRPVAHGARASGGASMRPGRMPRKYRGRPGRPANRRAGFNEAGADAPEIPRQHDCGQRGRPASMRPGRMPRKYPADREACFIADRRFNEAGADAPEIPLVRWWSAT